MLRTGIALWMVALAATGSVTAAEVKKFPAESGGKLVLDLEAGAEVKITGTGGSSVEAEYSVNCTPPCAVRFEPSGHTLRIVTEFSKSGRSQSSDIELSLKVPARYDIEVDSMGGGLSIDGVEGKFTGKTMGGELTLRNVRGEATLSTMGGEIHLSDSELDGSLKTMGGAVEFENVVGDVRGSSMGGNVRYRNVRSTGGRVASPERTGGGIAKVDPETVQISTMGGEIKVEEAPEGADLHTMGGDIEVRDARRFVRAKTMGGNVEISSIDGWVDATTMGGNIDTTVTGSGGDVTLTSMSGEIVLTVPAGFGMDLDLEIAFTRNSGKDYKITAPGGLKQTITPDWDHDHGTPRKYIRVTGAVNGGGRAVKVRTVNGNIKISE
jgi:hypothetical protein